MDAEMIYSFDLDHVGLAPVSNRALAERLIPRPPGVDTQAWFKLAGDVCTLLNVERTS